MDAKRLIPVLGILDGQAVTPREDGTWTHLGRPAEVAGRLELEGADALLMRAAGVPGTGFPWIREVAAALFIPFAVQAPFATLEQLDAALAAGADQVVLEPGADPALLAGAAAHCGRMRVAVAAKVRAGNPWRLEAGPGAAPETLAWMEHLQGQGVGSLLLEGLCGHPAGGQLLQAAARSLFPLVAMGSGEPAEAAELLLHGADGVAFPVQATATATLKAALAGSGLSLRW